VRILTASVLPAGLQTLARRAKAKLAEEVLDAFEKHDVLLGAGSAGPAGPIVTESPVRDEASARATLLTRNSVSSGFTTTGGAAISIPAGFTSSGLPVGLQLGTRPMDEATLFRISNAFQRATDHHQKHPPMDWAK
jgi:aspartyl-tRNA(Asn)/glutamyl-tRNA(Gln) amidotransferase subunit A